MYVCQTIRGVALLLVTLAVVTVRSQDTASDEPQKPNIVFILADDLGWGDIGYNNPYVISPTIDTLAREGVTLNQSYVQPICTPSRGALFSGYYPYRIGMQHKVLKRSGAAGLPLHLTVFPEKLREQGYATYMVGKWHLGYCSWEYTPLARGFDRFYGFLLGVSDYFNHTLSGFLDLRDNMMPDWGQTGVYSADLFSEKASDFITYHDQRKPMFLYLSFQSVHGPLQAPQKYIDMYPSIKNENRRIKLAMVTAMDDAVKNVVSALKDAGMSDNTLIVFSSDNGGTAKEDNAGSNWPLRGSKTTLWEGGTRAVGFVHGKMLEKTGYVSNELMHIVDWYPTLLGLAGGEADPDIDGIDVWNTLSKGDPSPRTEFVYNIDEIDPAGAAIRMGDYKLIVGKAGNPASWTAPPEMEDVRTEKSRAKLRGKYLFNIIDDPTERNDIKDEMPEKVAEMEARLKELTKKIVPAMDPKSEPAKAHPRNFNLVWSPGWCYCN
ncbi:arylsulfatase I-like [Glandiceps talaboti]